MPRMKCRRCGIDNKNAKYCHNCGARLGDGYIERPEKDYEQKKKFCITCNNCGHVNGNRQLCSRCKTDLHNLNFAIFPLLDDNNITAVRALIARRIKLDTYCASGETALMLAARRGQLEIVQLLLAHHAPVNTITRYKWTALMEAALNGHLAVVHLLLAYGAKPDMRNAAGASALLLATANGHREIVRLLLEQGVRTDHMIFAGEHKGMTANKFALKHQYHAIVQLLNSPPPKSPVTKVRWQQRKTDSIIETEDINPEGSSRPAAAGKK